MFPGTKRRKTTNIQLKFQILFGFASKRSESGRDKDERSRLGNYWNFPLNKRFSLDTVARLYRNMLNCSSAARIYRVRQKSKSPNLLENGRNYFINPTEYNYSEDAEFN